MFFKVDLTLLLALSLLSSALALGINCEGSTECTFVDGSANSLSDFIQGIDTSRFYNNGEHIACSGTDTVGAIGTAAICAYLQNTDGAYGSSLATLAPYIPGHHCSSCGSVPTPYPGDNNVANGELTFNYVSNGCGDGLC